MRLRAALVELQYAWASPAVGSPGPKTWALAAVARAWVSAWPSRARACSSRVARRGGAWPQERAAAIRSAQAHAIRAWSARGLRGAGAARP